MIQIKNLSNRDSHVDNIKFIMILFVILGHWIEPMIYDTGTFLDIPLLSTYIFIYFFHMPILILLSGYLAKKSNSTSIGKYLTIYIIFQVLYKIFNIYVLEIEENFSFSEPDWILWFLLSLVCWRIITPYIMKLRYPIAISIIIAVLAGYDDSIGSFLSLSRTLSFLPFYLFGYKMEESFLEKIRKNSFKIMGCFILLVAVFLIYYNRTRLDQVWLYFNTSYSDMGVDMWYGGFIRLFLIVLCFLVSISIIAIIPSNRTFFTTMGTRTMQVYLLHGFIRELMGHSDMYWYISDYKSLFLLIFSGIIATFILASKPVEILMKPLLGLNFKFLYKKD